MKHALFWFLILSAAIANPTIVYEGVRDTQMTGENVLLRIAHVETAVTGEYVFVQLAPKSSSKKDEFVRVLLPVYTLKDTEPKLSNMKHAYGPKVTIQGITYEPVDVMYGGHPWSSYWRGASFTLVAFEFAIPLRDLPEQFRLHVTYTQPHLMARGVSYACYCPFRPKIENQLYREIDDQQFILQALASDGVNLKLVSKNTKVKRDGSAAITLNCIHLEHVVIRVKKTQSDNKE